MTKRRKRSRTDRNRKLFDRYILSSNQCQSRYPNTSTVLSHSHISNLEQQCYVRGETAELINHHRYVKTATNVQDSIIHKSPLQSSSTLRTTKLKTKMIKLISLLACLLLILLESSSFVGCVVVHQVRFIATQSGRTDYALAGESIELSCLHMMKDEAEDIKQLVWSKDGKNFLRWRKNKPGLEVLSYTFKGHIDPTSVHSHVIIHNTTIEMHGKYKCSVKTDLNTHESELDLTVISSSQCKFNNWRIASDQTKCRELFRFDCRQLFPRPVSSCGLWNSKTDKFIQSISLDISEEPISLPNVSQTYRVKYVDKFDLILQNGTVNPLHKDLLQYAGHLIFKCDILIPETSWRLSLMHKMFDFSDGCNQDPLEAIERMRANFSQNAKLRLQQLQKYSSRHQLDEIELLTTNLKYEILPSTHQNLSPIDRSELGDDFKRQLAATSSAHARKSSHFSGINANLNCWQRPRLGSLARLSCVLPPSPPTSTTEIGAKKAAQLKLSGAKLLECRPNGWIPINPSSRTGSSATSHDTLNSNHFKNNQRVTPNDEGSLLTSRAARKLDEKNTALKSSVQGNQDIDDGQDDDDNTENRDHDNSAPLEKPDLAPSPVTGRPTGPILNGDNEDMDNRIDTLADLTPGELASLLPSCILISSQTSRRANNGRNRFTNNRLPLLDDEGALLESTANTKHSKTSNNQLNYNHNDSWLRWFTLMSSSASSSATRLSLDSMKGSHYLCIVLQLFLVPLLMTASMILSTYKTAGAQFY